MHDITTKMARVPHCLNAHWVDFNCSAEHYKSILHSKKWLLYMDDKAFGSVRMVGHVFNHLYDTNQVLIMGIII